MTKPRPAVFLDRDGTLNTDVAYLTRLEDMRLLPGVGPRIQELRAAGFACVVVTNQSAVGRGMMTEADLRAFHEEMTHSLPRAARPLTRFTLPPRWSIIPTASRRRASCCAGGRLAPRSGEFVDDRRQPAQHSSRPAPPAAKAASWCVPGIRSMMRTDPGGAGAYRGRSGGGGALHSRTNSRYGGIDN